jgi:FKBP-type peptidyl-prolyl cis-trans isomerase FklB
MKRLLIVSLSIMLLFISNGEAAEKKALQSQRDKVSYSIGLDIGNNLKRQSIDVDPDIISQGIKDILAGNEPSMTETEIIETMMILQKELMEKQAEKVKQLAEKNKTAGEAFLAENKKKDGVITLPSGLQYKIIKEGTGKTPKLTDTVTVNYRGTFIDGTEFDSSFKRGEPATFPVNGVIAGWTEALQLMKEGSNWQLFIPSNLAYGDKGAGVVIEPNSVLIFDVELISVK